MVQIKETESKYTPKKKTITVKDSFIENGILTDDDGADIIAQIEEELPKGVDRFSFKITFELPEDEESDDIILD